MKPLFFCLVSAAVKNIMTKVNMKRKWILWFCSSKVTCITGGSQGNNSKQESRGRISVEAACWIPPYWSMYSFTWPSCTGMELTPFRETLPFEVLIKKMSYRLFQLSIWWRHFLTWCIFPDNHLCQADKKFKQDTSWYIHFSSYFLWL